MLAWAIQLLAKFPNATTIEGEKSSIKSYCGSLMPEWPKIMPPNTYHSPYSLELKPAITQQQLLSLALCTYSYLYSRVLNSMS